MATIKVTYNSISRRFNIEPTTTWVELESKLRSLYNIPTTSSLTASYTDEDGDVITFSSDLELQEILSQQISGKPIKLVLNTTDDWVLEDDNKSSNAEVNDNLIEQQNQTETVESEEENVESRPPSYYQHVSLEEEPEYDQSTPLLNKEKGKESEKQNPESSTKDTKTQPEKENKEENGEDDEDEIIFLFSHLPSFFGPRFGGPRFGPFGSGPRFGPFGGGSFGGPFGGSFGGPFGGSFGDHGLFSESRYCPYSSFGPFNFYNRPQCYRPAFYGPSAYYFSSRNCGPNACKQKSNTCEGNSKTSCCSKSQQSASCKNAEASTSKNHCRRNSRPSCSKNFNFFHPRYHNQTPLSQEQLNDKLSILQSMGFDSLNNALYEDLLKRYNGNVERVIELLLRNQEVDDNEKAFTNESEKVDNEKASTSESKKVDNEESKPYTL